MILHKTQTFSNNKKEIKVYSMMISRLINKHFKIKKSKMKYKNPKWVYLIKAI